MNRLRPYVLPIAIVLGLLLHSFCAAVAFMSPIIIFCILLLTFCAVDLRQLRIKMLDVWLMTFQIVVGIGGYLAIRFCGGNSIVAEGVLVGVLCPVASSVAVIACILGANRETVTTYTVVDNLMVAIVAPVVFTLIGEHTDIPFGEGFMLMLGKIGMTLALPFFLAAIIQFMLPRTHSLLSRHNGISFYLWAIVLTLTFGQTINYLILHATGNWGAIIWLAVLSLMFCVLQFGFGRWLGGRYGDVIAGGQCLGQKNTAFGIWMANTFLNPLSSVFLAFYCVYQNLFNAWQMARQKKQ